MLMTEHYAFRLAERGRKQNSALCMRQSLRVLVDYGEPAGSAYFRNSANGRKLYERKDRSPVEKQTGRNPSQQLPSTFRIAEKWAGQIQGPGQNRSPLGGIPQVVGKTIANATGG